MRRPVTISSGLISVNGRAVPAPRSAEVTRRHPLRTASVLLVMLLAFGAIAAQLVRLASVGSQLVQISLNAPLATSLSRPDLVDRNGRLLASDVEMPSLYADPLLIADRDEVTEKLRTIFPDLDSQQLRDALADKSRRFVWIKRQLAPQTAQLVHNLGLPGLAFRQELRRAYPSGRMAGHVLGGVNVDNRAVAGIERHLDEAGMVDAVVSSALTSRPAVALSLDMRVQHAVEEELVQAVETYRASGASAIVLDVDSGELIAAASLPFVDPARPEMARSSQQIDRNAGGTYELGSIFKLLTVAMALDDGRVTPETMIDVTKPIAIGRFEIKDHHAADHPLSVADIFHKSSNVGAGRLALDAGSERQRAFLTALGLTGRVGTQAGAVAEPQLPKSWGEIETATIAFGHGLAVAPLQFASAAAATINGGLLRPITLLKRQSEAAVEGTRVISEATSLKLREMMRRNVADKGGTGSRAAVAGYDVGGKTGTAEIAVAGRYDRNAVIASFLAAFPIDKPRYLTLVLLFEPERTAASAGEITASHTAAPLTSRIVGRIAPLLGLTPRMASIR